MNFLKGFLGLLPQLLMKGDTPAKQMMHSTLGILPQMLMHHDTPQPPAQPQPDQLGMDQSLIAEPMSMQRRRMGLRNAIVGSLMQPTIIQTKNGLVDNTGLPDIV